jgi:hypothetical protein
MITYLLPESLRNELISYLMTRPCGEVMPGVLALQQLQPAPAPVAPDDKPPAEEG